MLPDAVFSTATTLVVDVLVDEGPAFKEPVSHQNTPHVIMVTSLISYVAGTGNGKQDGAMIKLAARDEMRAIAPAQQLQGSVHLPTW